MKTYIYLLALVGSCSALSALALPVTARGQVPLAVAPQEGVLLLRGGQVLRGKITPAGDRYLISLPSGEARVRTADVELHCRDLQQAYERKRTGLPSGSVHAHLDLAQWCIYQDLLGCAASELGAALAIDPRHPRIALLERKIRLAQHRPQVTKASFEPLAVVPSAEELDRLARGMPPGTVETFTNSIQPLLLNNCTSGGCHGPSAVDTHRWDRITVGRASSRRLTLRNLHTTLEWIDREKPLESPLLTTPMRPHGDGQTAVFSNVESPQFKQLVAWVWQVSRGREPAQPATVESQASTLSQAMPGALPPGSLPPGSLPGSAPITPAKPMASGVRQAIFEETIPLEGGDALPAELEAAPSVIRHGPSAPAPRSQPLRGDASPTGFVPKDPFDPELFNRRFFPAAHD